MKDINLKVRRYKDACVIKPMRNRSVMVLRKKLEPEGIIIQTKRLDITEDEKNKPIHIEEKVRGITVGSFMLNNEAAMALYLCLSDYFSRILPSYQETK